MAKRSSFWFLGRHAIARCDAHVGTDLFGVHFERPAGTLPAIRENDLKHIVLDVMTKAKLATESVDLPIAFVFIGKTEAE